MSQPEGCPSPPAEPPQDNAQTPNISYRKLPNATSEQHNKGYRKLPNGTSEQHNKCYGKSAPEPADTDYTLSEAPDSAFHRIATLAPTLREAELKTLIELTRRALGNHHATTQASSRELATTCKISRAAAQTALHNLTARGIITERAGNTRKANHYILQFLLTVRMPMNGGLKFGPPPTETWPKIQATLDQTLGQGGLNFGPPPTENTTLPTPPGALDITIENTILDRVLTAHKKPADKDLLVLARHWMHHLQRKLGSDPHAHPPDDAICAQFLAVAEWPRLEGVLKTLMDERTKPGNTYGWFVAVAIQRTHGITADKLKNRRAQLRIVTGMQKARAATPASTAVPTVENAADFQLDLIERATAGVKKLR